MVIKEMYRERGGEPLRLLDLQGFESGCREIVTIGFSWIRIKMESWDQSHDI